VSRPAAHRSPLWALAVVTLLGQLILAGPAKASGMSPAPGGQTPPGQLPGRMRLVLQHVHASRPFALVGERIVVRGVVTPFVAGQKVSVTFSRDGHPVSSRAVALLPVGNGAGQFHVSYASPRSGVVSTAARHSATPLLGSFAARSAAVRFIAPDLAAGASGPAVRVLQYALAGLHYAVPLGGAFDEATGRAVIAYRKMTGLARIPTTNARVFRLLQRGAGKFHVRFPRDGRHVEADLTTQALAEIEPGGHVRRIYTMSSGKPSTPTVLGHYEVYSKTPGVNSEGMVDSNYFIRGYAIHGYPEVPTYAASHGCLRVPIPDAPAIFGWVRLGTVVDVYDQSAATAALEGARRGQVLTRNTRAR
jgi:peptidoglycan hydrolase-like protein with peptidoglycan-binding domain